jgi:hypothetical protein
MTSVDNYSKLHIVARNKKQFRDYCKQHNLNFRECKYLNYDKWEDWRELAGLSKSQIRYAISEEGK